jgi:hypothetical protein
VQGRTLGFALLTVLPLSTAPCTTQKFHTPNEAVAVHVSIVRNAKNVLLNSMLGGWARTAVLINF